MAVPASDDRRGFPIGRLLLAVALVALAIKTIDMPARRFPGRHPRHLPRCSCRSCWNAGGVPRSLGLARWRSPPRWARWSACPPHRAAGDRAGAGPAHQSAAIPRRASTPTSTGFIRSIPVLRRSAAPGRGRRARLLATALAEILGFPRGAAVPYLKGGVEVLIEGVSVLVMSMYLARHPGIYADGVVALAPPRRRRLRGHPAGPQRDPPGLGAGPDRRHGAARRAHDPGPVGARHAVLPNNTQLSQ